jgi:steroid 5-alpha-reductase/3-oxo-5-alpha-steroid 4-dehydrogenase 1
MDERAIHTWVTLGVIATAVPTLLYLLFRTAPYGRHGRAGWGPTVSPRFGWILMESPAVLAWLGIYLAGPNRAEMAPLALAAMWQAHYIHRTFIFPFRMRGDGRRMPLVIAASGAFFNVINAYVNARWVSTLGSYPDTWLTSPWFLAGAAVFAVGMAVNLHADTVLLNLRAPGETGYKIPRGGLYRYLTCPNYFGELLEWLGWTLATASLAGLSFFVFTAGNLLPRALAHHRWYREKFPEYPAERRALIPGVL